MTSDTSVLMIANPTSGRGRGRATANGVAANLRARGHEASVRFTERRGDAERIATEALALVERRPNIVVACGGDGTIQEVANALATEAANGATSQPIFGLAPAGRCNDFTRVLGISTDPARIAETLATGKPVAIDLGRVNGRYFCTVVTVGIDAEITRFVDTMRMPLRGTPAYLYGALRVLLRYKPHRVRLTGDFGVVEQFIFLASTANTSSYGGAVPIVPDARPDDGALDLCVISAMSRLRALTVIPKVLGGRHGGVLGVQFLRTKRLVVESDDHMELWADGERIAQTPATIEIAPSILRVMVAGNGHPADMSRSGSKGRTNR